jgi:hypothetical protein
MMAVTNGGRVLGPGHGREWLGWISQPAPQGARHLTVGRLQQRLLTAGAIIADPLEMLAALTKETTTTG